MGKTSKTSIEIITKKLIESSFFVLTTHLSPDGDGLGGILALGLVLKEMGKDVDWLVVDPIPKNYMFIPSITKIKSQVEKIDNFTKRQIIVVDSSDLERVGGWINDVDREKQIIFNIDHHISNTGYGDFILVDSDAAAVCELVYVLISNLNENIAKDIATCLLTGLVTDTGCFRFSNTTVNTLELAARLIRLGGRYREIITNVYEKKSYQEVVLLGKALETLKREQDGKIAWLTLDIETIKNLGISDEQTENIINLVRDIDGVQLAILFKEIEPDTVKISFRSRADVDVAQLALIFGGGGHPRASGCTVKPTNLFMIQELVLNNAKKLFF